MVAADRPASPTTAPNWSTRSTPPEPSLAHVPVQDVGTRPEHRRGPEVDMSLHRAWSEVLDLTRNLFRRVLNTARLALTKDSLRSGVALRLFTFGACVRT